MEIALALGMVVVAIVLLSIDRIPIEVSSLAIVVLLVATKLVSPPEALAGFSSETAIFIFALLALTQGLGATGVMQIVGRRLLFLARISPGLFTAVLLTAVCGFSAVASNTAVTAAFLPVVVGSAAQARIPASRLLMPVAFASMLGGTITLFGTSTNLVVSASMESLGLGRIGFLELTRLGLPLAVIGLIATMFVSRRLLRTRAAANDTSSLPPRAYLTEAALSPGSRLLGRELRQLTALGVPVRGVVRKGRTLPPEPQHLLSEDDKLIIAGGLDDILRVKDLRSVGLRPELRPGLSDEPSQLVEVSVPPTSALVGESVKTIRFADRYGLTVLAIHRHPTLQSRHGHLDLLSNVADGNALKGTTLSTGDVLLLSGSEDRIRELAREHDVMILGGVDYERPRYRRAAVAVAIFVATIILAGTRAVSPAIAGLGGMLAMVATGCVESRTAFRVDWRVVIMIGSLLTLGLAMEKSGAGEFLARGIIPVGELLGARGVLVALMVGTVVLSIPMSNQAAALIMLPIGVHAAQVMGLDPRTFAIGTCLAASCSFMTPLEPSAALVYGPGRYRFTDFLRVGGPVTALALVVLTFGVPLMWPFAAR